MNLSIDIMKDLEPFQACRAIDNGVVVSTHCLYPNNSSVSVSVRGAGSTYVVTDDGGAFREAEGAGAVFGKSDRKYEKIIEKQGLKIIRGVISTPTISLDMVPMAILLVANASKEIADSIFNNWRPSKAGDFKEVVRDLMKSCFPFAAVHEEKLVGTSNKPHSFDNVISLPQGRKIIVDPVLQDANSINSRVVANLDVKAAGHKNLEQRLIYNDEDNWSPRDLSLLQVSGVPVIAFSHAEKVIGELLAA